MNKPAQNLALLALFTVLLVIAGLLSRQLVPIDETRYVSVAWEMWLRGDFLVPFKNGAPYAHKPPLLFWLYQLGWAVFGVNDLWPRLVSPLSSLACLLLVIRIAGRLRPELPVVAITAPWILAATLLWQLSSTAAMFDVLLTVWVLAGILGIVQASQCPGSRGFVLLGLSIGMGVLAKGPVILLHVLPLALLAPWWARGLDWKRWYGGIVLATLLGAVLALCWAIPAGIRGGEVYRHAIIWGQTVDRLVDSFAHRRPFWWYLPWLPLLLYPWLIWPGFWKAARAALMQGRHRGVRFCLAWAAPVFIAFSFISGKQAHYLVPLLPAFALFAAQALADHAPGSRTGLLLPGMLLPALGVMALWFAVNGLPAHTDWAGQIAPWSAVVMLVLGGAWALPARRARWLPALASVSLLLVILLQTVILRPLAPAYDVRPVARYIHGLQVRQVPLVHVGNYHDQYQFAGRLERPLQIMSVRGLAAWFDRHPDGMAIVYVSHLAQAQSVRPEFYQLYRGEVVALVNRVQAEQLNTTALQQE